MTPTKTSPPPTFIPDHRTTPGSVPAIVDAALFRLNRQISAQYSEDSDGPLDHAARCDRLAELHARCARWWRILNRHNASGVPFVYLDAVSSAGNREDENARFWRGTASDWRARAEQRPTSDTAGSLSNWRELGVA